MSFADQLSVLPVIGPQLLATGLMMGALYALMALGIAFIASIMKMINWSMGEFYMIGSYVQFLLISRLFEPRFGSSYWYLALPISMLVAFSLGIAIQRLLLAPMFRYDESRR